MFDTPLEAVGNLAGLPLRWLTAAGGQVDPDIQSAYDQAARTTIQRTAAGGQAAKGQWSKRRGQGRITGLWQDFGPATNLVDQLGSP